MENTIKINLNSVNQDRKPGRKDRRIKTRGAAKFAGSCLSWLKKLGYQVPWGLEASAHAVTHLVWKPFLRCHPVHLEQTLVRHKANRSWFLRCLGASREEASKLLSKPPKGLWKGTLQVIKEYRKPAELRHRPIRDLRLWTTALYSTRLLVLPPKPNLSSIVSPPLLSEEGRARLAWVPGFWRELRYTPCRTIPRQLLFTRYHLTYKKGPNGPGLATLGLDFAALPPDLLQSLSVIGGPLLQENLEKMKGLGLSPQEDTKIRRIASFSDMEGKTRVIGILDYFSQTALKKLHHYLYKVLARIPQDCTFDQGKFVILSKDWRDLISCDLTDATDRFPQLFTVGVLKGLLPDEYVDHWNSVMVGYSFSCGTEDITYATGNPMGAYSSWASFAVAHHYVVYAACVRLGIRWSKARYAILGDDIIFGDVVLYREYRTILRELGVEVSEAKTHESKTILEFAKRWIYKGVEITPFPLPALKAAKGHYNGIVPLLTLESKRGWEYPNGCINAYLEFVKVTSPFYQRIISSSLLKSLRGRATSCKAIVDWWTRACKPHDIYKYMKECYNLPEFGFPPFKPQRDPSEPEWIEEFNKKFDDFLSMRVGGGSFMMVQNYLSTFEAALLPFLDALPNKLKPFDTTVITWKDYLKMTGTDLDKKVGWTWSHEPPYGDGPYRQVDVHLPELRWHPYVDLYESQLSTWSSLRSVALQTATSWSVGRKSLLDTPAVLRSIPLPSANLQFTARKENIRAIMIGKLSHELHKFMGNKRIGKKFPPRPKRRSPFLGLVVTPRPNSTKS